MSVHRRRLSDEGAEAGLSRKQRQDRRKQRVSPSNHNSWHQTPPCAPHSHSRELAQAQNHSPWASILIVA